MDVIAELWMLYHLLVRRAEPMQIVHRCVDKKLISFLSEPESIGLYDTYVQKQHSFIDLSTVHFALLLFSYTVNVAPFGE